MDLWWKLVQINNFTVGPVKEGGGEAGRQDKTRMVCTYIILSVYPTSRMPPLFHLFHACLDFSLFPPYPLPDTLHTCF